jgi:hypothetical protein
MVTSHSNTLNLLCDDRLYYKTSDLTNLTDLFNIDMNPINTTFIQKLLQALRQSVELV